MNIENNLPFITSRISEIGSALLFSQSSELIKFPASIITILKTDDEGHLWFFAKSPVSYLSPPELQFPARLQFYRKGKPFYVEVEGLAHICDDQEAMSDLLGSRQKHTDSFMLVKLKINKAIYHEPKQPVPAKNFLKDIRDFFSGLFMPSYHYRSFEIKPEAT